MKILSIFFVLAALCPSIVFAEWTFQFSTGSAYNFPMPLRVSQEGHPDIETTARYDTNALSSFAWYYDLRAGRWKDGKAWELETQHHKIYLSNGPPEIDRFSVSHGYNLNTLNRAWLLKDFIFRLGGGFVITHPETVIRGREYIGGGIKGFHLSGLTAQAGAERRFDLSDRMFLSLEAKLTASYAEIPVSGGEASVPVTALHGLIGIGYRH